MIAVLLSLKEPEGNAILIIAGLNNSLVGRSSKGESSNKIVVIYYFLASTTNFV